MIQKQLFFTIFLFFFIMTGCSNKTSTNLLAPNLAIIKTFDTDLSDKKVTLPFVIPDISENNTSTSDTKFTPTALAFDSNNTPYMIDFRFPVNYGILVIFENGKKRKINFFKYLQKNIPTLKKPKLTQLHAKGSIVIDKLDNIYILTPIWLPGNRYNYALLFSTDKGKSFQIKLLQGDQVFIQKEASSTPLNDPPVIGILKKIKANKNFDWVSENKLSLIIPEQKGRKLIFSTPLIISKKCAGISLHSGGSNFVISLKNNLYFPFAKVPQNGIKNPIYIAKIDRKYKKVVSEQFLANSLAPEPDSHASPIVLTDINSSIHILLGAHNRPIQYMHSSTTSTKGWSMPLKIDTSMQTYPEAWIDGYNTIHVIYRTHPRLMHQYKTKDMTKWSNPQVIVKDPDEHHMFYTIFFHHIYFDRKGNLFLAFTFNDYQDPQKKEYPNYVLVSSDNAKTWSIFDNSI